jgi:FAD/FMN-containing dehydrogenase/Fe-S oxidoreductase
MNASAATVTTQAERQHTSREASVEHPDYAAHVDAERLEAELRAVVKGEVRFDEGSRALYATDGSNYRQVPIGVVIPRSVDDVVATVAACRRFRAPVLSRGGGTSLAGQCCNVAVVMDFSKYMNNILELNVEQRYARVQPGLVLDHLRNAAEEHHLTFAPDPSTHNHCTLGGMIGNNSCGVHSVMGGKTDANVQELDILLYDGTRMTIGNHSPEEIERIIAVGGRQGEIYRRLRELRDRYGDLIREKFPKIPRRVSGYGLEQLLPEHGFDVAKALVGSEGTCVVVLEAKVRLVYSPPVRSLLVLGYPDVYSAGDHVMQVMAAGPVGLEGLDDRLVEDMKKCRIHPEDIQLLPEGGGWLMVEFGGETKEEADGKALALMAKLKTLPDAPTTKLFDNKEHEQMLWKVRESGLGATARVPGEKLTWEGWEDAAVPPERLGGYLRDFRALLEKHQYACSLYGHFGQGCVHTRIDFDLFSAEGIKKFRSFLEDAADLVVSYGGSLSGEHGDGQSKAELLPRMFGPEMIEVFNEFKSIWDPDWKMNPGKVVRPYRVDENLRLGTHYDHPDVVTHFKFPEEGGFKGVALRCVGIGECRRHEKGTMCPSYRVTLEEKHSTRGRARLLFEMLEGNPLKGGWRQEEVKDALDLCLACKGCKGDCPVNVDMATYKAEFLSHYYEGHARPRHAYAMGLIHWWARLAAVAPRLANFFSQSPLLAPLAKWAGGIAQQRRVPAFAPQTFKDWFRQREVRNQGRPQVILWPDTFNNHFHPEVAQAGVEVLEAAGFQVLVPQEPLCCGRPLYDFGMLDLAKAKLRQILDTLRPHIQAGTPIVAMEPSCAAVFKDELSNLFPEDEGAHRLREQTFFFGEFLEKRAPDFQPPPLPRKALVHGHCHQKALERKHTLPFESKLLDKLGMDYEVIDSGCCGMAGSFGFEASHYDVSQAVGDLKLLPAVKEAAKDTLIIADGFSCHEQIEQATDRHAIHLAQAIQMALHERREGLPRYYPEQAVMPDTSGQAAFNRTASTVLIAGALLGLGAIAWRMTRKRDKS